MTKAGTATTTERAVAALDLLPEEMREPAIAYLLEQAEKYRVLKQMIDVGMSDIEAGRTSDWDFATFLTRATAAQDPHGAK